MLLLCSASFTPSNNMQLKRKYVGHILRKWLARPSYEYFYALSIWFQLINGGLLCKYGTLNSHNIWFNVITYLQKCIASQKSSGKDENVGICKGTCNLLRNFDAKNRGVKILFYFFSKVCRLCIATVERKRWNLMLQIVLFCLFDGPGH